MRQLEALERYIESLSVAWQDADQRQRNELANLVYQEVWVNGPRVEYVKPRPELEPLFQTRVGAAQTLCGVLPKVSHSSDGSGDPDGRRSSISECLYLRTSLPSPAICHDGADGRAGLVAAGRLGVPMSVRPTLVAQIGAGGSLRALAREYGVSHETIRRIARATVLTF